MTFPLDNPGLQQRSRLGLRASSAILKKISGTTLSMNATAAGGRMTDVFFAVSLPAGEIRCSSVMRKPAGIWSAREITVVQ